MTTLSTDTPTPSSTSNAEQLAPTRLERIRWASGPSALALGPVLTSVGFALHPRARENDQAFVALVNAHPTEWAVAHLLIGLGLASLATGVWSALRIVRGKRGAFLVAGTIATAVGAIGMGYDAISHGAIGYALSAHPEVPLSTSTHVQANYESLSAVAWTGVAALGFPLGALLLGIGALLSHRVPIWGALLLLAGPVGISVAGAGPLELLGAAPLMIGFTTLARSAWRTDPLV